MRHLKTLTLAATLITLTTTSSFATEPAAPATKAECLKLLRDLGAKMAKDNTPDAKIEAIKGKAQTMAEKCSSEKFGEAFAVYGEMVKEVGLQQ